MRCASTRVCAKRADQVAIGGDVIQAFEGCAAAFGPAVVHVMVERGSLVKAESGDEIGGRGRVSIDRVRLRCGHGAVDKLQQLNSREVIHAVGADAILPHCVGAAGSTEHRIVT